MTEQLVACADQLRFVDFCIVVLGFEVVGWDAGGGRVESACGTARLRIVEGEPVPLEVRLEAPAAEVAGLAEAAAAAGAAVAWDGEVAVLRGPEQVTFRVAPPATRLEPVTPVR